MKNIKLLLITVILSVNYSLCFGQNPQATGSLQIARLDHQSANLPDGRVIVFGGHNGNYTTEPTYYASTEIYNSATRTWSAGASMNTARAQFASVVLNDGSVLAIGGENASYEEVQNPPERYNPATNQWSYISPMPFPVFGHQAVKLQDGRVLVAGGLPANNYCQIYDPTTDTWTLGDALKVNHFEDASMVLLQDGRVLITGGSNDRTSAEIYDSKQNQWTRLGTQNPNGSSSNAMIYYREDHSSVLLNDGRVLIAGGFQYQDACEIFDPATNRFTLTGNLNGGKIDCSMVLLPDGRVLTYGLGDFDLNTKIVEIYDPATGVWTASNTNLSGAQSYTLNALNDGSFLVAGGMIISIPTKEAYLIHMAESGDCSSVTLNNMVNTADICFGKDAAINITATQAGWNYQAFIGGNPASDVVGGGGNIQINVPSEHLSLGENLISIQASKNGCNTRTLINKAKAKTAITNNAVPQIVKPEILTTCQGGSIQLSSENTATGYLWSNGLTTQAINASTSNDYILRLRDTNGCLSNPSEVITVSILPPVKASAFEFQTPYNICSQMQPFVLEITPAGGVWSGAAIDENGLFNPSKATDGYNEVIYTYCGVQKMFEVYVESYELPADIQTTYFDYAMASRARTYTINNVQAGVDYSVYIGDEYIPLTNSGKNKTFSVSRTENFVIKTVVSMGDGDCEVSKEQEHQVTIIPYPTNEGIYPLRETVCSGEKAYLVVENSIVGVDYAVVSGYPALSTTGPTVAGTGGTIHIAYPYHLSGNEKVRCLVQATSPLCGIYAGNSVGLFDPDPNNSDTLGNHFIIHSVTRGLAFTSEPYYIKGDILKVTNPALYQSYTWTIDGQEYTSETPNFIPEDIVLNKEGEINIVLKGEKYGCEDVVSQTIEVFAPAQNEAPHTACSLETLEGETSPTLYFHIDKQGNRYVSGLTGGTTNCGMLLKKYNASGSLLWEKKHEYSYYPSGYFSFVNSVDSDNDGNLYVAGNIKTSWMTFDDITIEQDIILHQAFIMKINNAGVIQWITVSEHTDINKDMTGISDIHVGPASGHIFASALNCENMRFTDNSLKIFNSQLVILEMDSDGKFIKDFSNGQTYYSGGVGGFWQPNTSSYYDGRNAALSPRFIIQDGKIILFGNYSKDFQAGSLQLPTTSISQFAAVLDMNNGWEKLMATTSFNYYYNKANEYSPTDIDKEGNFYTAIGDSRETLDQRGYLATIYSGKIAKYDNAGNNVWNATTSNFTPVSVAFIGEEMLVFGSYNHSTYYNDILFPSNNSNMVLGIRDAAGKTAAVKTEGASDAVLISFDKDGNLNWVETIGGLGNDEAAYMIKDCNAVYLLGKTASSTVDCLGKSINISGTNQYFVAKYTVSGNCDTDCPIIPYGDLNPIVETDGVSTAEISWNVVEGATGYTLVLYEDADCQNILQTVEFDTSGNERKNVKSAKASGTVADFYHTFPNLLSNVPYYYSITALYDSDYTRTARGTFVISKSAGFDDDIVADALWIGSDGKNVIVANAQGKYIQVMTVDARLIAEISVVREALVSISVAQTGIYIVRAGDKAKKVIIK